MKPDRLGHRGSGGPGSQWVTPKWPVGSCWNSEALSLGVVVGIAWIRKSLATLAAKADWGKQRGSLLRVLAGSLPVPPRSGEGHSACWPVKIKPEFPSIPQIRRAGAGIKEFRRHEDPRWHSQPGFRPTLKIGEAASQVRVEIVQTRDGNY